MPDDGKIAQVQPALASAAYDSARATQYALLIQEAYAMYGATPDNPTPPTTANFPSGFTMTAWVQMSDFVLSSTALKFYGFIAQSKSAPDTHVLVIRGTEGFVEWLDDASSVWKAPFKTESNGEVSVGFNRIYETLEIVEAPSLVAGVAALAVAAPKSLRAVGGFARQMATHLRRRGVVAAHSALAATAAPTVVEITGHSLGAALATLYALDNATDEQIPNSIVYTFASPMVGDSDFVAKFNSLGLNSWRIVNRPDIVPTLPGPLFGYSHVGALQQFDSSGIVQPSIACWHAIATYLSLVDSAYPPGADCALRPAVAMAAKAPEAALAERLAPAAALVYDVADARANVSTFVSTLKANGFKAAGRYYSIYPAKVLTKREAELISDGGLSICAVYEDNDKPSGFDADHGTFNAQQALRCAANVGQPGNSAIYFAVDFNCDQSQIAASIIPYFDAIKKVFSDKGATYKIGVYGNGLLCETLLGAKLCEYTWLSNSTSYNGTKAFYASRKWNLAQHLPKYYGTLQADPNESIGDVGGFQLPPSANA